MRWNQGRGDVDRLIADRRLQRVQPSRDVADHLLAQAEQHLRSATAILDEDIAGGYALVYDAARKALTAVLENQGLRPTSAGGHLVVIQAVRAQLDPPLGATLRPFDRMRRQRNDVEYASSKMTPPTAQTVREDIVKVRAILGLAHRVLDQMSPY